MNKKTLVLIFIILVITILSIIIWYFVFENKFVTNNNSTLENQIINNVDLSIEYVNDDCLNEWSDYAKSIQEETKVVSNQNIDENTHYLVKNINGYINIFYLDDLKNETLYKKTDISTEYLSKKDLDDLNKGIEVIGSISLNQLLENYE